MKVEKGYDENGEKYMVETDSTPERGEPMSAICNKCKIIMICIPSTRYITSITHFSCPRCGGHLRPAEESDYDDPVMTRIGEAAIESQIVVKNAKQAANDW